MHNSFILQQYVCYTMILNMFRAACSSKHVEDRSVTYILLKNKGIVHYVGNLKKCSNRVSFCLFMKHSDAATTEN